VRVAPSKLSGRGVFARCKIPKGAVLGEYLGRIYEKLPYAYLSHPYSLKVDGCTIIAWPCCWCGYVNSVTGGAKPNVRCEKLGDGRVQFVAAEDIPLSAELLWDYGNGYWKNHEEQMEALGAALSATEAVGKMDLVELARHRW